ncbi:MAG: beta-lactamase family protein [Oligoflexia bacterium]|nr:beta-lactamase family protein [Oligoflexia bacterium]
MSKKDRVPLMEKTKNYLRQAISEKQTSAVALALHSKHKKEFFYAGTHGHEGLLEKNRTVDEKSIFDLASVSKIFSTVNLLFSAESDKLLSWDDPISKYFSSFPDKTVTIRDLASHRSGLPAHIEYFRKYESQTIPLGDTKHLLDWICQSDFPNKGNQTYSDLGFMLLGLLLESLYGKLIPELFYEKITKPLDLKYTGYVTLPHAPAPARMYGFLAEKEMFVATEDCPWRKKILQGEVHDDNTWSFGGYAGHAGLFSNLEESLKIFQLLLQKTESSKTFQVRKLEEPGIFSLGFMTYPGLRPFPGPAFATAIGHTGYTGTSAWFHPETKTIVLLYSNRVHPKRTDSRWIDTRLQTHKLLWEELHP